MSSTEPQWPYPVEPFQCHLCGNCCRGDGFVDLTEKDLVAIPEFLRMSREEFLERYCVYQPKIDRWYLKDQGDELQSCIFLTRSNTCQVHEVKPHQCQGFPMRWRPDNIEDFCEGWRAMKGLAPAEKRTMT